MKDHAIVLRQHVDRYCGEEPADFFVEDTTGIGVAKFVDVPDVGLVTFLSIGLSGHVLRQDSHTSIRQEFLMTVDSRFANLPCHLAIFSVSKLVLSQHLAVKEGQLIGPWGPIFPESDKTNVSALLCTSPAWFEEGFSSFENDEVTVFVELIPVTSREADVIRKSGWSVFLNEVDSGRIEILDYTRQ